MANRTVTVEIVPADALHVGPDEVLIIRLDSEWSDEDVVQSLLDALAKIGLKERALVFFGVAEMAVVAK